MTLERARELPEDDPRRRALLWGTMMEEARRDVQFHDSELWGTRRVAVARRNRQEDGGGNNGGPAKRRKSNVVFRGPARRSGNWWRLLALVK